MSEKIKTIYHSGGKNDADLDVATFYGGSLSGEMLQLTQGLSIDRDTPGYIQLTPGDAYEVIKTLTLWLKAVANDRVEYIDSEIKKNNKLKNTIWSEARAMEKFISDLEILSLPMTILGMSVSGENKQ